MIIVFIAFYTKIFDFEYNKAIKLTYAEQKNNFNHIKIEKQVFSYNNSTTEFLIAYSNKITPDKFFFLLGGFKEGKESIYLLDLEKLCNKGFFVISADYFTSGMDFSNKTDFLFLKSTAVKNQKLIEEYLTHFIETNNITSRENVFTGASLGSFIGIKPVSNMKTYFSHIAFIYSGADINSVLNSKNFLRINNNFLKKSSSYILSLFLSEFDPGNFYKYWENKKALFINGKKDASIPIYNSQKLHDLYNNTTKTVVWDEGVHIGANRKDILKKTLSHLYKWLDL